jgi:hypothetical protein
MANKKISELTSVTLPLAGTEELAIVQGGETKKVAASDLGGGGSSLGTDDHIFVFTNQSLGASTNWYNPRYNVANSIYNALYITGTYNGLTGVVTDSRMLGHIISFNQKATKITVDYVLIEAPTTFRIIYFKPNPTGTSGVAVDNQIIHEFTITNPGGIKQPQLIEIPSDVTMEVGGVISIGVFNDNVLVSPRGTTIRVDTEEVI